MAPDMSYKYWRRTEGITLWPEVKWNTLFKWETTKLDQENSEEKLENSKKAINFSKYPKIF